MTQDKYLTVGALTRYIKFKIDNDEHLKTVYIKGEISNFKAHTTGHFYFSLKDETSKINAIMFSSQAKKIAFVPVDGMKVFVTGRISVYESTGNYQIYVEEMLEDGVGNLYIAFEQLKEKLEKEGLFDSKHKKPIPKIPERIGIVTAKTGAAIKDILSTIKRRFPLCQTILFPSLVQGESAAEDIAHKIEIAQNYTLDILIVGRGGGSIEDLWAFNEEIVARAIYHSKIPVISAVGHEIDYTIADFVADLRAPTPTGAAEMAVPNKADLLKQLGQYQIRLNEAIYKKINYQKLYLESIKGSFVLKNPMIMYENKKQKLDTLWEKLIFTMKKKIENAQIQLQQYKKNYILNNPEILYKNEKLKLANLIEKLEIVNPMSLLKKGYTLTKKEDKYIKSIQEIKKGETFTVDFYDGEISAIVKEIKNGKKGNI